MSSSFKQHVLFLWLSDQEFHARQAISRGVDTRQIFRNVNRLLRAIRRLYLSVTLLPIRCWLNPTLNAAIQQYKVIIIHASILTPPVVRYINKISPDKRVIVWYWNPICKSVDLEKFQQFNCEIWVFDENDADKLSLNHNTQYYFSGIDINSASLRQSQCDVFFVGADKGRLKYLEDIRKNLTNMGVSVDFHITSSSKIDIKNSVYKPRISYAEVLDRISGCKVILDVVSQNQSGLTLRPLESIFYKKKLITNDKSIVNRDFYNKNNIHVFGVDDFTKLSEFIFSPYVELPRNILKRYDFDSWLLRFNNEN